MKTFIQWSLCESSEGPELATTPSTYKKKRERDRLSRMEALLYELVKTKKIVSGRTGNAEG